MPYSVDTFSGTRTFLVEDGTINTSLDVKLIGKNYAGYGEVQNENFVHMLENFAGDNPPPRPINGQIWYDSGSKKIKFWDSSLADWKSTGGVAVALTAPTGATEGDLWWNISTEQLFAFNGNEFVLVGPAGVQGFAKTTLEPVIVIDINTVTHVILAGYVDGDVVFVVSADDDFTLGPVSQQELGGGTKFSLIKKGVTLVGAGVSGISQLDGIGSIFWGTVSDALQAEDAVNATNSRNIVGGSTNQLVYQTSTGSTGFISNNTTSERRILSQTSSNVPQWIILPTSLPIALNNGTILNLPLANGTFTVQDRSGNLVNITVN